METVSSWCEPGTDTMTETLRPADKGPHTSIGRRERGSPRVRLLIDRLRQLVAEQRQLEAGGCAKWLGTYEAEIARLRAEIARLQRQLASAVRHELSDKRSLG